MCRKWAYLQKWAYLTEALAPHGEKSVTIHVLRWVFIPRCLAPSFVV